MPIKPISAPVAAEVRQDQESEAALIRRAKKSLSASSWEVGECASMWTKAYARGRTDDDFGAAIGLSGDQVYQRRRVWERHGSSELIRKLAWTHFFAALTWDDADACLQWAYEMDATVAEMKAWRRAQNGEDLVAVNPDTGDPFGSEDDPFGEGGGTDGSDTEAEAETVGDAGEDDDTEGSGTDSKEPPPPAGGRRQGRAGGDSETPPKDEFSIQKAKAVKTLEATMRAIDDLNDLRPIPQHKALDKALGKMIETVKALTK